MNLLDYIPVIEDFPKKGVRFRDVSPLLASPEARNTAIAQMAYLYEPNRIDAIAGIESRGFLFGMALAQHMGKPFIMIRKANKLPPQTHRVSYELEYGSDHLEIRKEILKKGAKVLIVDDVLATGGTLLAARQLIEMAGATAIGSATFLEIEALNGKAKLDAAALTYRSLLKA